MSISRIQVRELNRGRRVPSAAGAWRCRRKFLHFFPDAFRDDTYRAWERDYKWQAHQRWNDSLDEATFRSLLRAKEFPEIAMRAVRLESKTNLLFSFEKMALGTRSSRSWAPPCLPRGFISSCTDGVS